MPEILHNFNLPQGIFCSFPSEQGHYNQDTDYSRILIGSSSIRLAIKNYYRMNAYVTVCMLEVATEANIITSRNNSNFCNLGVA